MMKSDHQEFPPVRTTLKPTLLALGAVAAFAMGLHALGITSYGYFRDELYYLASTRHLALGYVDHPPFSIYLLAVWTALFGEALPVLRLAPMLIVGGTLIAVGLTARELGGGLRAQIIAPLLLAVSPVILGSSNFYSMNVLDQFFWAASVLVFVRVLRTQDKRLWLLLGTLLGLGLFNKISIYLLLGAIALALLATPHRRVLRTPWPWVGAGVALLLFSPYLIWQVQHGFPTLEFIANATGRKMVRISPLDFLAQQALEVNPVAIPVYLAGLLPLVGYSGLRTWRALPLAFLTCAVVLMSSGTSKAYYLAAAYPLLAAPGAVVVEAAMQRTWRLALLGLYGLLLVLSGTLLAPFAIPILSPENYLSWAATLGITPKAEERNSLGKLPQHFADMFGWQELVDSVDVVYRTLPAQEQASCVVYGQNYGEAGAIDVLGRRMGLPPAISGHNSYWYWGPGTWSGEVAIVIGGRREDLEEHFQSVEAAATTGCTLCMPYENGRTIWIARGLRGSVASLWAGTKMFI